MFELLRPADSLSWTLAWQSSLLLAIGLAATVVLRNRPARAHRALLATMLAALVAPLLTETGRRQGWGLWNAPEVVAAEASPRDHALTAPATPIAPPAPRVTFPAEPTRPIETAVGPTGPSRPTAAARPIARPSVPWSISWRSAFPAAWAVASLALGVRLLISFASGIRLLGLGRVVDEPTTRERVGGAADRLGLRIAPEVRRLAAVQCPAIWCWGREPVLLLPEGEPAPDAAIDWDAVFCHELAHWRRRDHLSALAGEILVCALPWNPLAWWSRSTLADLAELACDDWVLASGLAAADYAESLLGLIPQRPSSPVMAAVSSRRGLVNRLRHILADGRRDPAPGRRWTLSVCLTTIAAASALALAQARPAAARSDGANAKPGPDADRKADPRDEKTLEGTIVGPDGKPLAGASVSWVARRKPKLSHVASPRTDVKIEKLETLGRGRTDAAGAFQLTAPFKLADFYEEGGFSSQLIVRAPGFGLTAERIADKALGGPMTISIPAQVLIQGRLLTPGGMPARGVQVLMSGFYNDRTMKGMSVSYRDEHDELPEYWPPSQTTDADGRFTIKGAPEGTYVTVEFRHPDYALDEVTVNTIPERTLSPSIRGFEIVPVEPTFTHTLEPARPVEGRVTDKATGKPLAGMLVQMIPMRRHGGMTFSTRTDADGRYRVAGHSTDGVYFTTVYPAADSGYLSSKVTQDGWPVGAKSLVVNFALEKGRLIPGRVIDADGMTPVAGAAVVYQPQRKNPNNTGDHDLRNPVVTDADGRFTITALPGEGFLAVETSSNAYIRSPLKLGRPQHAHPQGVANVDISKEGEVPPVEIVVRKGVPLEARVLDPDGKPVDVVTAMYLGIDAALIDVWNQGREFPDGKFEIPGADPDRTYRVFFLKPDPRLGTVAELKYDPSGKPLEVRLQPMGTIVGRIGKAGGPRQGVGANVTLLLDKEKKDYRRDELFNEDKVQFYANVLGQRYFYLHEGQPNAEGEFRFEGLMPGASYYVSGGGGNREFQVPVWDLKPGEVRDVGEVKLEERPR